MPAGCKPGERRGGRQKGTPNKTTTALKEAILQAAESAGGAQGLVGYLKLQAVDNPGHFMSLLGKVLPLQVAAESGGSGAVVITWGGPEPKVSDAAD